jgi:hypothetical protein
MLMRKVKLFFTIFKDWTLYVWVGIIGFLGNLETVFSWIDFEP